MSHSKTRQLIRQKKNGHKCFLLLLKSFSANKRDFHHGVKTTGMNDKRQKNVDASSLKKLMKIREAFTFGPISLPKFITYRLGRILLCVT